MCSRNKYPNKYTLRLSKFLTICEQGLYILETFIRIGSKRNFRGSITISFDQSSCSTDSKYLVLLEASSNSLTISKASNASQYINAYAKERINTTSHSTTAVCAIRSFVNDYHEIYLNSLFF